MHKNDPRNPDLYVSENKLGRLPTREDILECTFTVSRDFVQSHRYLVMASDSSEGPIATLCITSTGYTHINKMLAELIVEGLEALKNGENVLLRNKKC